MILPSERKGPREEILEGMNFEIEELTKDEKNLGLMESLRGKGTPK